MVLQLTARVLLGPFTTKATIWDTTINFGPSGTTTKILIGYTKGNKGKFGGNLEQRLGDASGTLVTEAKRQGCHILPADAENHMDTALAEAQHAINATVHSNTGETPDAFTY